MKIGAGQAATFGGEYLHPLLHEQGAAYLFHLVENHPFVDGNERSKADVAVFFRERAETTVRRRRSPGRRDR